MTLHVVILAAGLGKRMCSTTPKVLHKLGGVTLIERVVQTAQQLKPENIYIVVGHDSDQIKAQLQDYSVTWVEQREQLGTGHAVLQVLPHLKNPDAKVLILYGDVPLIKVSTLAALLNKTSAHQLAMLTIQLDDPSGFGRIIRNDNQQIIKIVEQKDATPTQQAIKEINTGIYLTTVKNLTQWLPKLSTANNQQEYYLTDIVEFAAQENIPIAALACGSTEEVQGINDREQLIKLERCYQSQIAKQFLLSGVTLMDPARFDVRGKARIAQDVTIDINVILEGDVSIDSNSYIGPNCVLKNVSIGKNVEIKPNCVIENATIGDSCKVGPFARLRPETVLANNVSIGNFVELKKSHVGANSKIPHLSYVGDAALGEKVNFSAGAITCNYDGANKRKTTIGNNVFVGSDVQLIAPVTIEEGAFIAAGSTITKNAPANKLTLSRAKQTTIDNWQRPKKEEK
jgi:bifunctional UDP-N-acetylglucosamine pyrophosphorylase / glucosamine-1-phosphate N-acetyltransferase